jgi:hypothetical protein
MVICYHLYHEPGSDSLLRTVGNPLLNCMLPWRSSLSYENACCLLIVWCARACKMENQYVCVVCAMWFFAAICVMPAMNYRPLHEAYREMELHIHVLINSALNGSEWCYTLRLLNPWGKRHRCTLARKRGVIRKLWKRGRPPSLEVTETR